ncbi:MAG TPA: peptidase M41, partial [Vicingus sp.]|nr:peptidase M41 [Vicingus sp.]
YDSTGQSDYSFSKPYSEKTAQLIDEEVKNLIETSYIRTKKILEENKDKLIKLAEKLLEKEVIFRDDLEEIFGKSIFEAELNEEKKVSKKAIIEDNEKQAEVKEDASVEEKTTIESETKNNETNI